MKSERSLCLLQTFGPEGGNHGATTDTVGRLQQAWCWKVGARATRLYQHGGSQALARSEVLAAGYCLTDCTDFVWLDSDAWLEGTVRDHALALERVIAASDALRAPIALPYVTRLSPEDNRPAFACSFPEGEPRVMRLPNGERVAKLQGTGFGFVHCTREHIATMREAYKAQAFRSERPELAGHDCVYLFGETLARKAFDNLDASRPVRALPEDDSYWHRAALVGVYAYSLVDLPLTHRGCLGDLAGSYELSDEPQDRARHAMQAGSPR
jgi:hypothetical protein